MEIRRLKEGRVEVVMGWIERFVGRGRVVGEGEGAWRVDEKC